MADALAADPPTTTPALTASLLIATGGYERGRRPAGNLSAFPAAAL